MNILEKGFIAFINASCACNEFIEKKTGRNLLLELGKMEEKDEKQREEHPWKWAGKKILWGTIKGITGASFHKD